MNGRGSVVAKCGTFTNNASPSQTLDAVIVVIEASSIIIVIYGISM